MTKTLNRASSTHDSFTPHERTDITFEVYKLSLTIIKDLLDANKPHKKVKLNFAVYTTREDTIVREVVINLQDAGHCVTVSDMRMGKSVMVTLDITRAPSKKVDWMVASEIASLAAGVISVAVAVAFIMAG